MLTYAHAKLIGILPATMPQIQEALGVGKSRASKLTSELYQAGFTIKKAGYAKNPAGGKGLRVYTFVATPAAKRWARKFLADTQVVIEQSPTASRRPRKAVERLEVDERPALMEESGAGRLARMQAQMEAQPDIELDLSDIQFEDDDGPTDQERVDQFLLALENF